MPTPVVELRFSEGTGITTTNAGSLSGSASFAEANAFPVFTNLVPTGPFAPSNNSQSVDFGTIAAGQGGQAVDLATDAFGTLGPLNAFTLCGWLNARDLNEGWGGNRVAFALESLNGPGFDLVQLANGSLRIGINQWPDGANGGGPSSSVGKLKADPQAGTNNWVYFAVTYDPVLESGNLKYFFGSPSQLAALDTAHNYKGGFDNGGLIEFTGLLTIGNLGSIADARNEQGPGGGSRVFRGLVDEIKIYDRALEPAEVQQAQLNGALPAVPVTITSQPASQTVFAGQSATFRVEISGSAPFTFQWQTNGVDVTGATNSTFTWSSVSTNESSRTMRVRVGNSVTSGLMSDAATLTVLPENGHKLSASFSDGGATVTNTANLQGGGLYVSRDGYPVSSAKVPSGTYAPLDNIASVDFGVILDAQGGRAIDFTNAYGNTMGPMTGFTACGWVNAADLRTGGGGNRLLFALASPGGPGFDLVQLSDGALQLGVNQWPDGSPALSSAGRITESSGLETANWVFFAVAYDGTQPAGNVSFFFGTADQAAQLDLSTDYDRGPIVQSGALTIGNFGAVVVARNETGPTSGSRCFRGLIDEINVFNKLLTLEEIQQVQKAPAYRPVQQDPVVFTQQPQDKTAFAGEPVTFGATFSGTPPFQVQWQKNGVNVPEATNATWTLPAVAMADNGAQIRVLVRNVLGEQPSQTATLTVVAETGHKISISFSEAAGTNVANSGNLAGQGQFAQANGFPVFSTKVPSGANAPTLNLSSLDMGIIADGQGGRAVDFTNSFGNTLGSMNGFTACGWVNAADLRVGWGGNRILFALASPGGPGFDLVQLSDGALQLGVNQWPDGSPALSSAGRITEDPGLGSANWVFFAVTYDGTQPAGNVSFFFGTADQTAQLDLSTDYDRGPIVQSGALTIGNFGAIAAARNETGPTSGSRCFRGLLDELNVFNKVLTIEEIQQVQKAPAQVPVTAPSLQIQRTANTTVELGWESTSAFQLQSRASIQTGNWTDVTTPPTVQGNRSTVAVSAGTGTQFFRLRSK